MHAAPAVQSEAFQRLSFGSRQYGPSGLQRIEDDKENHLKADVQDTAYAPVSGVSAPSQAIR